MVIQILKINGSRFFFSKLDRENRNLYFGVNFIPKVFGVYFEFEIA